MFWPTGSSGQQLQISPDVYSQLKFRYIGPIGGRTTAVAGIPGNPYVYYVGAAAGGIFKSTDQESARGQVLDSPLEHLRIVGGAMAKAHR